MNGLRPVSVIWFERLFLASLAPWTAMQAMTWNSREAQLAANPVANFSAVLTAWTVAVGAATIVFWYFAARRRSGAARVGVAVMAAGSAVMLLFGLLALASEAGPPLLAKLLSVAASGLTIAAAAMLFRDDARAWFAREGEMQE